MKTKLLFTCSLVFIIALTSCQKENKSQSGNVKFSFSSTLKKDLKCTETASALLVTIEDMSGTLIYDHEKIELYTINGCYISKPISLPEGHYQISQFMVINEENTVIYVAPLKNSGKAYLVNAPLPIPFEIMANSNTQLIPEVLSVDSSQASDFGYTSFSLNIVGTFDFLISVFCYNATNGCMELTTSKIKVSNADSSFFCQLLDATTQNITVKDNQEYYTLTVEKSGYLNYNCVFTADSLKAYNKTPLIVQLSEEIVTDIDGNQYHTVRIGNQVWMKENLMVTHYNDGTEIPTILVNATNGGELKTPAYFWYYSNKKLYGEYGALYDWYAVNTNKLCISGWHIPSSAEWDTLINTLGGYDVAGGKLKEVGTDHWNATNSDVTNSSGFTALGGGYRTDDDNGYPFYHIKDVGIFWTSQKGVAYDLIWYSINILKLNAPVSSGYSVRCIKDNPN
jgi:uncharacterized protein (TIGR02145 family)